MCAVVELHLRQRQPADGASDDDFAVNMEFHAEARVNPAEFQETSPQGTSGEIGLSPVWKELPAAQADLAGGGFQHDYFVDVIAGKYCKWLKRLELINLAAIGPIEVRPGIENGNTRDHCPGL